MPMRPMHPLLTRTSVSVVLVPVVVAEPMIAEAVGDPVVVAARSVCVQNSIRRLSVFDASPV